ncbi:hypothetical protein [Gimesia algae]|uniref:Uncharacterized protein n=1 Tax=Gimesia algae TaxID=2527971 RepID=A0A517V7Z9_9PLAN|nr:hypothetical protein [Gimesia algae]QDT89130.1 hypothetical protein Pan161_07560 [Gimesia algae]
MDKLKPLIVHKFWIILFIALLLPVIGWSMATGSLAKEIEERQSSIDQAFTDAQVPSNPPNQTWSTALKQINEEKRKYNAESTRYLWEKQKELFVWPPDIATFMTETPYRGEISIKPRNLYRSAYKFEILRAHKLANPYNLEDGKGLVDLDPNIIPHVPLDKWETVSPTSEDMWNAQEDVWLVTSILKAIAKVNEESGAANISESPVRQISVLELRGGTVGDDGSAPAGDGGMGMDGEMGGAGGGGMFGGGGGSGGGMGGMADGKDGSLSIDVDMDLVKIFGNDVDNSGGGGDGGSEMPMDEALGGGFGGGMGGQNSQKLKRYYNEEEELPYKTRAFYLKATIQSSKLPNLLAQLSSMPWPTKIIRVQRADLFDDSMNPIAASTGGGMGRRGGTSRGAGGFGSESDFTGGGGGFNRSGGPGFESDMGVGGAGNLQGQENKSLLDSALNDPELAVVTIAGLMTLYKPYVPPEGEVVAENTEQPQAGAEPTDAAASTTPADGSEPAAAGENPANPAQPAATTSENTPPQSGGNTTTPAEPATPAPAADSTPSDTTQPPAAESKPAEPVKP